MARRLPVGDVEVSMRTRTLLVAGIVSVVAATAAIAGGTDHACCQNRAANKSTDNKASTKTNQIVSATICTNAYAATPSPQR
jgi:hypothetical protein